MKKLVLCLAVCAASVQAASWRVVENGMPEVELSVEEVATPRSVVQMFEDMEIDEIQNYSVRDISSIIMIEKIVNLGLKLWGVIEKNQPTIKVKTSYANALPLGVKSAQELDGFSSAQFKSFRMNGSNWYGGAVYDVTFTLVHRHGGNFKGKGQYLDAVTVLPHDITASWGYNIDLSVDSVSTVNVGTNEAPVGSALMQMTLKVGSVLKKSQYAGLYEFRGDSAKVGTLGN